MVPNVMSNGAHAGRHERQPLWRNRKIIAIVAAGAAAVAAVSVALAATGNGAKKPQAHAAAPVTASTWAATPRSQPSAATSAPASQSPAQSPAQPPAQPPAQSPIAPSAPATAGSKHTALVTQAELGSQWPLTVSSGWLRCDGNSNAYTFKPDAGSARTYALNLEALKLGLPSITAIQIQSQAGTGEPADVSPLQERAADLC
jgi:hypothetical protein